MLYIDLHAHILPGLDDGPQTLQESLQMAAMAVKQGIQIIAATPHVVEGIYENEKSNILENVRKFQAVLLKENIPLKIIPGAEIHISSHIFTLFKNKELLTINNAGKYILLELPHFQPIPPYLENLVFQLSLEGIRTIIAHPERIISVQKNPNILIPLIAQGVLLQCTLTSISGHFGEETCKTVEVLLKSSMVHFLASDMHNTGGRLNLIQESLRRIEGLVGKENAKNMISHVPEMILEGRDLRIPYSQLDQMQIPKRNLWGFPRGVFAPRGQNRDQGC